MMEALRKTNPPQRLKQRTVGGSWKTQLGYYLMFLVPVLYKILFSYIPMSGIYLAFIEYKPAKGIFGSAFVGLTHFKTFFKSVDFVRIFRNTVMYNVLRAVFVELLGGMFFALMLYEIRSKVANKIYHTCMLLPAFISWTVVSAALLLILHPDNGFLNDLLKLLGMKPISWYREQKYWPTIILLCMMYKGAGMNSIYFYSALLSIDPEQFDAAEIDGANRLRQIRYISIPAMRKVFCITLIMSLGNVLDSSISPYYQLTFDQGNLYETTQVLGTYLYKGLGGGRFSFMTAVGLVQSMIGLMLVIASNTVIKRVDPDSAMF